MNYLLAVLLIASLALPVEAKKPPFSERHPKVYRQWKKVRRGCVLAKPVLEVGSLVAITVGQFI